jgi:hypothetical protein
MTRASDLERAIEIRDQLKMLEIMKFRLDGSGGPVTLSRGAAKIELSLSLTKASLIAAIDAQERDLRTQLGAYDVELG